jgi:hypothetical protein
MLDMGGLSLLPDGALGGGAPCLLSQMIADIRQRSTSAHC